MTPFPIQNTSLTKTTLQIPTLIPWESSLQDQKNKYKEPLQSSIDIKTSTDLKLKNPVFKPYQITKTSQTQLQENQTDFLKAIKTHLQHLDNSSLTVPDTPQTTNSSTSTNQVSTLQKSPGSLLMKVLQTNLLPLTNLHRKFPKHPLPQTFP